MFFVKHKTSYEMRISDWSSDVCSSDLALPRAFLRQRLGEAVDARFGGGIVDLAVLARLPVDRADVDDAAPAALDHAAKGRFRPVEAAAEVDAHDIVPIVAAPARPRADRKTVV